jgi:branched-chain amino acid transport system substrate-binding protein
VAAVIALLSLPGVLWTAHGQLPDIEVGLIAPVSGPFAHQGQLLRKGAEMAVEDINGAGGIKTLGGRKIQLVVEDAGDTVQTARNAAQRLVASKPDLAAGMGAWLSAFTLAVTEVTERARIPWLTLSYADSITARGFRYVIQTLPVSSAIAGNAMPAVLALAKRATGRELRTVAIVSDSTAADQTFVQPLRSGGFEKLGVKILTDEVYTSPLADAATMVQRVRRTRPDFVLFLSPNFSDAKLVLAKMNEFGLGGGHVPIVTLGTNLASPEMLKALGPDLLEGLIVITPNWTSVRQEKLLPSLIRRSGDPWLEQNSVTGYGEMLLIADALERARSTERAKVIDALRATDLKHGEGPAMYFMGDRLKFDENGRRVGGSVALVQWQGGRPYTVWPPSDAFRPPQWVRR